MTRQINISTWLFSIINFMHLGIDDGSGASGDSGDGGSSDGGQGDSGAGDSGADGGDGGQGTDWLAGVSDELKTHSAMEPIKDINGLVDSFVNAQSMIGSSIRIPGEDASNEARAEFMAKLLAVPGVAQLPGDEDKEGWTAFYRKLGAPEKPEDYKIGRPDLPDGYEYDDDLQTAVLKTAQEHGVSQKAMEAIFGTYWDNFATTVEGRVEEAKVTVAALKTEWGAGYSQRMGLARQIITQFGGEELSKELDEGTLGNNPELAKMLSKVGEQFTEDGIIKVDSKLAETKTELESKIAEVRANLDHPYYAKSNPGHKAAVAKMDAWNELLDQYK